MKKQNNNNLTSKLFNSGLIEQGDLAEIKSFKAQHKKSYTKAYNKAYLKDKKAKTVVFTKDQYKRIKALSNEYQMPEATFIKACVFAYLDCTFITPDKETVKGISHLLLAIKNSVNQSIQYVHMNQDITYQDIQHISQQIADLESFISQSLSNPPRLSVWLKKQCEQNQNFLAELLLTLSQVLSKDEA